MLVLSRTEKQRIVIDLSSYRPEDGHIIEIEVTKIASTRAKLGFSAPDSIRVHRQEVQDRIDRDKNGGALCKE